VEGKYALVGANYLDGFMYKEALKSKDVEPQDFILR